MNRLSKNENRRSGFTLTEAAVVMGIAGMVLGGIWTATAACYESWKVDRTTTSIILVLNELRTKSTSGSVMNIPSGRNYYDIMKALNVPQGGILAFLTDSLVRDTQTKAQITKLASASNHALKTVGALFTPGKAWAMANPETNSYVSGVAGTADDAERLSSGMTTFGRSRYSRLCFGKRSGRLHLADVAHDYGSEPSSLRPRNDIKPWLSAFT